MSGVNATRGADSPVCWAPECANVPPPSRGTRPTRYCSSNCRVKAMRRNGGKAPSEPYPPYEPNPALDTVESRGVTVSKQSERIRDAGGGTLHAAVPQSSDAAGKARKARRDSVQPPVDANTGTAPAPAAPPQGPAGAPPEPAGPAPVTQLHVAVTQDSTVPVQIKVHPMVAQYRVDLEQMGMAATRQGLQVLEMAERLVSSATSPAAAANLSKELDRLMADLEQNTPAAMADRDPSLVIRERTLAKLKAVREHAAEAAS